MVQIQLVYGLPEETVTAVMMLKKNSKAMVHSHLMVTLTFSMLSLEVCLEIH